MAEGGGGEGGGGISPPPSPFFTPLFGHVFSLGQEPVILCSPWAAASFASRIFNATHLQYSSFFFKKKKKKSTVSYCA